MKPLVYLAGPIAGISGTEATSWRDHARFRLLQHDIESLNPLRAKYELAVTSRISTDFHDYERKGTFFTSKAIMARDYADVVRCDALLVNLLSTSDADKRPSYGTVMELAWAYMLHKPAVVAIEPEGSVYDGHPMLHEAISFRVATLDEAIEAVAVVLNR